MASFDVSSLFTNIPLDETMDLCTDLVFDETDKLQYRDCSLDRTQFRKLLGFAVKENHFVFNGQLFDQIDGVAMGSPLGPSTQCWTELTMTLIYLSTKVYLFCVIVLHLTPNSPPSP